MRQNSVKIQLHVCIHFCAQLRSRNAALSIRQTLTRGVVSMTTPPSYIMRQKDYSLDFYQQKAAQHAVLLTCIAKRYTKRHKNKSSFSSSTALATVAATFATAQNQIKLMLDRPTRISESDFRFNFNRFSDREALLTFRFRISDIIQLVPILNWAQQQTHTNRNRYAVTPTLTTCIVLRRIAVPDRWEDLCLLFGIHPSQMSEIFWESIDYFVSSRDRLLLGRVPQTYMEPRVATFSKAISDKGAAVQSCVGFVDGTVVAVALPKGYMQLLVVYNGHKRKHALKYQAINTSDGMIVHAHGPVEGRRHDWYLYHRSGIEFNLEQILLIDGVQYVVYGDSGYNWRVFMEVAFQGSNLNANQTAFNTSMSKVRVTVEWIFKEVKMYFPIVDTKRKMKL